MLHKLVTYTNVDGDRIEKDLYFNIGTNEILEKEVASGSTYSEKMKMIAASDKLSEIYPTILEFIESGYGIRTEDGDFVKDETGADWRRFKNSLSFQALMDELLMDPSSNGTRLADFITGMLPPELAKKIQEQQATPGFRPGASTRRPTPPVAGDPRPVEAVATEATVSSVFDEVPKEPYVAPEERVAPFSPDHDRLSEGNPSFSPESQQLNQTSEPRDPELPGQPRH